MAEITKEFVKDSLTEVGGEIKKSFNEAMELQKEEIKKEMDTKINEVKELTENKFNSINVAKGSDEDNNFGFKSFGEFANTIAQKAFTARGSRVMSDEDNHKLKAMEDYTIAHRKALNESIDSQGGFLVPTEFSNRLINRSIEQTNLMQRATKISTRTNAIKLPIANDTDRSSGSVHGGIQFYWIDEEGKHIESEPTFRNLKFELNKLGALVKVTDEMLEDNVVALETYLPQKYTDGFIYLTDQVIMRGDGNAKPKGFLNSGALVTVAKEAAQSSFIEQANLTKMITAMPSDGDKKAIWIMNKDMLTHLMALNNGTSPIFLSRDSLAEKPHDMLLGRPIVWSEHCSALKSPGDIILADMSKYIVCSKANAGLKMSSSIHVDFEYDKKTFKFVYRMDGQTMYHEPFKYANGQSDKSYFVTLADRN